MEDRWQALMDGWTTRAAVHEWAARCVTARHVTVRDQLVGVGLRNLHACEEAPVDPQLVTYRPLADAVPAWQMALAWNDSNTSPTLERLIDLATAPPTG